MPTAPEYEDVKIDARCRDSIQTIWGYVRNNQASLDSERARRMITGMVRGLADVANRQLGEMNQRVKEAKKNLRDERKRVRTLEDDVRTRKEQQRILQRGCEILERELLKPSVSLKYQDGIYHLFDDGEGVVSGGSVEALIRELPVYKDQLAEEFIQGTAS